MEIKGTGLRKWGGLGCDMRGGVIGMERIVGGGCSEGGDKWGDSVGGLCVVFWYN